MLTFKPLCARVSAVAVLLAMSALSAAFAAQDHVVSLPDLHQAAVNASSMRQHNVETVTRFMASPRAKHVLDSVHLNETQVKTAVSKMSDQELAELASRVNKSQADFGAGSISDRDLILLLIAIVVLILVIVAVR